MAVSIREAFEQKELKYKEFRELLDGATLMVAGFNGEKVTFDVMLVFDAQDHTVMIRTGKLAKVPVDRQVDVYAALNELNRNYRWARFFVDNENDIVIQMDHIVSAGESPDAVMELVFRMVKIVDESYPKMMRAIWA